MYTNGYSMEFFDERKESMLLRKISNEISVGNYQKELMISIMK
jgi:hypothetical protein